MIRFTLRALLVVIALLVFAYRTQPPKRPVQMHDYPIIPTLVY